MPSLHHYQHRPTRMVCLIQLINLHWQIITTPKSIVYIRVHLCALHSVVVQLPSRTWLFATSWTAACQTFLSLTTSQSLSKFMFIALVMSSSHLILWGRLLLLPSIFPSIGDFSNESVCIIWPKHRSFSFSISPSNEYSGLISLKIDWIDLAVQGTLRSLLQHHSSKASILWCSAFFMVQFSQLYVTTGKTIALTICTFVSRVMSLLCNTLSRFVLSCQEGNDFWFHGCSHHPKWF